MKLNLPKLKERCLADPEDFWKEGDVWESKKGLHIFKDNGAQVLGVAHLDTVQQTRHFKYFKIGRETHLFNCQLDDRLGAHVLLDLLPRLGIKVDVLLTEGEESGDSTAADFTAPRDYNWVFQFDRAGTDVVMYQYEDAASRQLLKDYKFDLRIGSFSDIAMMEMECKAFNFGVGYYDNHMSTSHAILNHTVNQVKKFVKFYEEQKNNKMAHDPTTEFYGGWYSGYSYAGYGAASARYDYKQDKWIDEPDYSKWELKEWEQYKRDWKDTTKDCVFCMQPFDVADDWTAEGLCPDCAEEYYHEKDFTRHLKEARDAKGVK